MKNNLRIKEAIQPFMQHIRFANVCEWIKTRKFYLLVVAMSNFLAISCNVEKQDTRDIPLMKIAMEDLESVNLDQWSEVEVVDGRKTRSLNGDETTFILPTWWGNTNRPNEDDIFVLEMDYKDVTSQPFIVSSFGNCQYSVKGNWAAPEVQVEKNGMSELHRIRGENTLEWRTAFIPVSWDYLYAGPGNPGGVGQQLFGITLSTGDKNLPISEFRIRKATKEDEVRYNAETRAWIQESQKEFYRIVDDRPGVDLPDEWKTKECVPYMRNYLSPIMPYDVPGDEEMGATLKVRMSQNEIECLQLGVYANGQDMEDVSISLSELRNDEGDLFQSKINLFTVEYAYVKGGRRQPKPTIDPQRIWPLYKTPIKAGHSQAFWLSFDTGMGNARAGLYKGEINILSGENTVESIPLEVEVMPINLLTMNEAGLSMGGCVTGFVPFHNISYAIKNNVNATNLWFASMRPDMSNVDGKLVLDFTLIDEWMKEAKRLGLQNIVYFLGGNPYGFPGTMTLERELFVLMYDNGSLEERTNAFLKRASDESNRDRILDDVREYYSQWVGEVAQHALNNNWPELIFTPFDEPAKHRQKPYRKEGHEDDDRLIGTGPWIKGHFEDGCNLIRKAAPTSRIYGSIHDPSGMEFLPYINVFCTNVIYDDPTMGDQVRAGGKDKSFWQYTGVGAGSDPAKMRYSYGFYFGAYDSRGSLLWAYNWGHRFNTTEGYNWMICWDTPFSTIPTLSYEGLREAWDDRRYIETLKKIAASKGLEGDIQLFLTDIFKKAVHSRMEGGEDSVNDFWNDTKDLEKLDMWRYAIADKILEISK